MRELEESPLGWLLLASRRDGGGTIDWEKRSLKGTVRAEAQLFVSNENSEKNNGHMDVELRGEGYKMRDTSRNRCGITRVQVGRCWISTGSYNGYLLVLPMCKLSRRNMAPFTAKETRGRRNMHVTMQELEGQRHSLGRVCLMGEIALGWHQDTTGSFGVELGGRVCGPDSTSLGDSRKGSMTWEQSRNCLWQQHVARKETEGKYQELVTWQHSRTPRRANYRWQLMARCCYRIAEQIYDVCIYLSVHLRLHMWHILNPCSVKWCWKVWSDKRYFITRPVSLRINTDLIRKDAQLWWLPKGWECYKIGWVS